MTLANQIIGPDERVAFTNHPSDPPHFTGKERDTESGNDYFGARYYSSAMGRFISPDPMNMSEIFNYDDPQSWNGNAGCPRSGFSDLG